MKILRLHHNEEIPTGNFKNKLDQAINIKPYSKIGLINCSIDLKNLTIVINETNKGIAWGGYANKGLNEGELTEGSYNVDEFLQELHYTLNTPEDTTLFLSDSFNTSMYNVNIDKQNNYILQIKQGQNVSNYPNNYTDNRASPSVVVSSDTTTSKLIFKRSSTGTTFNAHYSMLSPMAITNCANIIKFNSTPGQFLVGITDRVMSNEGILSINTIKGADSPYLFCIGFAGAGAGGSNNNYFIVDNITGAGYVEYPILSFAQNDEIKFYFNLAGDKLLTLYKNNTKIGGIDIPLNNLLQRREGGLNTPHYFSGTIATNDMEILIQSFVPDPFYSINGDFVNENKGGNLLNNHEQLNAVDVPGFQFNPGINGSKLYTVLGFENKEISTVSRDISIISGVFNFLKANRESGYIIMLNNSSLESFDGKGSQEKRRNILALLSKESVLVNSDKIDYEANTILKVDFNNALDLNLNYFDVSILGSETDQPIECDRVNLTLGIYDSEE